MKELLIAYAKLWDHRLEAAKSLGEDDREKVIFAFRIIRADLRLLFLQDPFER